MQELPLVSVNMPVKNGVKYIKEAIQSVLNQTFNDFELIIVNDGSTDESAEIVRSFSDSRIKILENQTSKGIAFSRNLAIENSLGKYIAIFDCDDIMLPENLQKKVVFLEQNSDFAMVGSSIEKIDKNGDFIGKHIYKLPPNLLKTQLFFDNYFAQSAMLIRKDVLTKFYYDKNFSQAEDYLLWSKISENHKVANLKELLIKYRIHNQSISNIKQFQMEEFIKKVFEFQLSKLDIFPTEKELENHFILLKRNREIDIKNSELITELKNWTKLLKTQNNKLQIFDNKYFNKNLKRIWRKIYKANMKKNNNFCKKLELALKICKTHL
ncbi:MAG: glycosyltransferase [Prevotellaceae bacterium]|jgi:glycosyltransferase involved in cell wall biosynthesis|nr:glycosyltransferase [Prevotellaceae bacterium]